MYSFIDRYHTKPWKNHVQIKDSLEFVRWLSMNKWNVLRKFGHRTMKDILEW